MTYTEAVAYLESLGRFGMRFGLSRMEYLTAWLGHPEHRYAVLHVLGTNGKGSTAAMLAGVLRTAGYRVGLYTSPHLHEYTERIRVNGRPVAKQRFADAIRLVQRAARAAAQAGLEHPTAFEVLTAAAYQLLADEGVEVLVQEAGLGGRLDATACVPTPMVTVFTRIALDHVERLGPTAVAIAREKAAAVKGGIVVLAPQEPAVAAVVEEMALARGAAVVLVGREAVAEGVRCGPDGCRFTYRGTRWTVPDLHVPLPGYHQVENATAAAAALEAAARSGLRLGPLHLRAVSYTQMARPPK
ncbi:MAG: bifunctional folylpolyglutamate synthase/dihydrofolate synthase, partial [Clostridia bacterium]|nr:bifunctional folylpolyglutamate synthase/dihydrofolate synthase [Clostridia bacterium]